jgi:hypothetical protein
VNLIYESSNQFHQGDRSVEFFFLTRQAARTTDKQAGILSNSMLNPVSFNYKPNLIKTGIAMKVGKLSIALYMPPLHMQWHSAVSSLPIDNMSVQY